jgi:hypothetical protein
MRLNLLALLAAAPPLAAQSADLAITNVTVVDVAGGRLLPGQTVVIRGPTIAAAGATASVPKGARRIDGTGKYLIPGLWDMHVHLSMIGRSSLALFLANGVTGVRDMGGDPVMVLALRDSVASGAVPGPRIKAPGNIVESARWLNNVIGLVEKLDQPELLAELKRRFALDKPSDGPWVVDSLVRLKADFIKIRNYPSPEAYAAFARAARERGLKIAGHGPPSTFLGLVSDSGFVSFEHSLIGIRDGKLVDAFDGMPDSAQHALIRRFVANGTAWDPTLVSSRTRFVPDTALDRIVADSTGATDSLLRYVSPVLRRDWRASRALASVSSDDDWGPLYRANLRDVRRMWDLGVTILAGTDAAVVTLLPGFSLHDELELLVSGGGLTPREALAAATINPARVWGLSPATNLIAPQMPADLVLLDRDPLADVRATRAVRSVIAGGRLYDRAALDRLLESAR